LSFLPALIFSTGLVFARTAFFDVLQMQGDRITGKETLPILLGEKKSLSLITGVLFFTSLIMLLSSLSGFIKPTGFALAILPLSMLYALHLSKKGFFLPGTKLELIVESHFILAGLLSVLF